MQPDKAKVPHHASSAKVILKVVAKIVDSKVRGSSTVRGIRLSLIPIFTDFRCLSGNECPSQDVASAPQSTPPTTFNADPNIAEIRELQVSSALLKTFGVVDS